MHLILIDMENRKVKCQYVSDLIIDEDIREDASDPGYHKPSGFGFFHCWGQKPIYSKDEKGNISVVSVTVAIVEDIKSGVVYTCHPDNIKFDR